MSHSCTPCQKSFQSLEALDQHLKLTDHVTLITMDQLQISQKSSSRPLKSGGELDSEATTKQSDPSRFGQQSLVQPSQELAIRSQAKTVKVQQPQQFSCTSCNKNFKNQAGIRQHLRDSKIHNPSLYSETEVSPVIASETSSTTLAAEARALPLDATTSSKPSGKPEQDNPKKREHAWTVVQDSQFPELLASLSRECHTKYDLQRNKYLLRPCDDKISPVSATNPDPLAKQALDYKTFATTPVRSPNEPAFRAVALDCEMVKVVGPKKEVVLVCAIDYFTGAVLMNRVVAPTEAVIDWKTPIHGISAASMAEALSQGIALTGWKEAREELWKIVDQDTILVGHALQHDLNVLHMIHTRVVDSAILTTNAIGMGTNQIALKTLTKELLGIEIRSNEGGAHDALEDVLATREIVLWCIANMQQLDEWSVLKRAEIRRKEDERIAARRKR